MKGKRQLAMLLGALMLLPPVAGRAAGQDTDQATVLTPSVAAITRSTATLTTDGAETTQYQAPEDTGALPPQMGWSSWNCFYQRIDQEKILGIADTMVETGLLDAGYVYLNIDDCWQSNLRDEEGRMMFDLDNFPDGPGLIDTLHDMGLKVGLYSSCGEYTCQDLTASYGHEEIDAMTFAQWGVDYLKYDYCHVVDQAADQGWETLMNAPEVDYISIMPADAPSEEAKQEYEAEDATLTGNATVITNWDCQGSKCVTGLNANGGTITFENVEVPESGTYILTIGHHKMRTEKGQFAEIVVNGTDKYETNIARSNGWSGTARQQLMVQLEAGSNTIMIHDPIDGQKADSIRRYTKMGNALKEATAAVAAETGQAERPIFYSVCEHGRTQPWTWAGDFANSWRTSGDIGANWDSVVSCYETSVNNWAYQKPGAYNDPDMMQVGNGDLTYTENQSHFTLWCMLSAPLILGNDVREFLNEDGTIDYEACNGSYEIVTNQDLIAINQDLPLLQCKRISTANGIDILVKPLVNQETGEPEVAVCFFNKTGADGATAQVDLNQLSVQDDRVELPQADVYMARDLWEDTTTMSSGILESGSIPAHGVKIYRVSQGEMGAMDQMATISMDAMSIYPAENVGEVTVRLTNLGTEDLNSGKLYLTADDGVTVLQTESEAFEQVGTGEVVEATFQIQLPAMVTDNREAYYDTYGLTAKAVFTYENDQDATEKTTISSIRVSEPVIKEVGDTAALGDANWLSTSAGWVTETQRNTSYEGRTITIAGATFDSGIGTHANSDTEVYVGGTPCTFTATVGIDDEVKGFDTNLPPGVTFHVLADGQEVYATEELGFGESEDISVFLGNCQVLTLRVDMGERDSYDHADWGNATLTAQAHTHTGTLVEAKDPTCTVNGNIAYWVCQECGKCFADQDCTQEIAEADTILPATGHTTQLVGQKDATCTQEGYTGDQVCTVCGQVVEQGQVIDKLPHDYQDGVCVNCGAKDPDYVAPSSVDKTLLQKTYDYAVTLSTDGVTDSAKQIFQDAVANAKAVLDNPDATQEQVDEAWSDLLDGIWGLGLVQGDKTMLELVIDRAQAMIPDQDKYVPDHWQELVDALAAAQTVMDDGDAMQKAVDEATGNLLNAILAQRFKADKDILEQLIGKAEAVDLSGYTQESVDTFRAALTKAQAVLADEALSEDDQDVVDQAVAQLTAAMDGLTAGGAPETTDKPETTNQPEATEQPEASQQPSQTQQPESTEQPQQVPNTGDNSALVLWTLLLAGCAAGVGALTVVGARRRQH